MDINNTLYKEINRIGEKLKSLESPCECVIDINGRASLYRGEVPGDADCMIKHREDGFLIFKGSHEFMIDAMSSFIIPSIISRAKKEAMPISMGGTLRLLGHHASHLARALNKKASSARPCLNMETQDVSKIYEKYANDLKNGLDPEKLLSKCEMDLIHRSGEQWVSCIRRLYESTGSTRDGFCEEKDFWCRFYMSMCYIREFREYEVFRFAHDVLRKSGRFVIVTTLDSLLSSDKYFELGKRLYGFYEDIDFSGIYFPKSLYEFKDCTINAIEMISKSIGKQSKMARKLILVQMDRLVGLIMDHVNEHMSIGLIECFDELLIRCIEGMSSLSTSMEEEESEVGSFESSLFYEFRGRERLERFYAEFEGIKRVVLFTWSFKRLGKVLFDLPEGLKDKDCEAEHRVLLQETVLEVGDPSDEPVVAWMAKDIFDPEIRSQISFHSQEIFASDVLNAVFERVNEAGLALLGESDSEVLSVLLGEEDGERFSKLCKIMEMFRFFNSFDTFSRRTLNSRMMIIRYLNSIVNVGFSSLCEDCCSKVPNILILRDLLTEVDRVLRLFFGEVNDGMVHLSEIRKTRNYVERQTDDVIDEWSSWVLSDGFFSERVVRIHRVGGGRKFKVSLGPTVLKRLEEYLVIVELEDSTHRITQEVREAAFLASKIKSAYAKLYDGCNTINMILEDMYSDMDLFYGEVDAVFASMENILELRWKDVKETREIDALMNKIGELESRVYSYRFFVMKVAREEMRAVFSKQIQKRMVFSLESKAYLEFFKFYEKSIVIRGINRSMGRVFLQYLESVLEALKADDSNFFISRHRIKGGRIKSTGECCDLVGLFEPPLSEYFKILDRIFPSESGYFFDEILLRFNPDDEAKARVESIIEAVRTKYSTCLETLEAVFVSELPSGLYERFTKIKDSCRSVEMLVKNMIPFFVFEHCMDASEHIKLLEAACDEVQRFVDIENSRVYEMLTSRKTSADDAMWPKRGVEECDLVSEVSQMIEVSEYLNSNEFKTLEELNKAVSEHGMRKPGISIELLRKEKDASLKASKEVLNAFLNEVPFDSLKLMRKSLVEEARILEEKIDDITREKDELMFWPVFKSLKAKQRELDERIGSFNKVLKIVELPMISSNLSEKIDVLDNEWSNFTKLGASLKEYESQRVCNVDIHEITSFLKSIDVDKSCAGYYKEFLNKIRHYVLASSYLQHVRSFYVKKKYFDVEMEMKQFFFLFNKEEIEEKLMDSRMEYEVERYIEKVRAEVSLMRLETRIAVGEQLVVSNVDDAMDKVNKLLVEHDSISRFNKKHFLFEELNGVKLLMSRCLDLLSCIEEVQKGILGFANVFSAEMLEFESKRYSMIRQKFSDSLFGPRSSGVAQNEYVELETLLAHEDKFLDIKKNLDDTTRGLKAFLKRCREETPRLYLVSDDDLIKALNSRSYYKEIVRMMFNIGSVIDKNGNVIGFESCGERVMLRKQIPIDQSIGGFVRMLSEEIRNTLKSWFYESLEDIKEGCPSIILDLVTEFKYFSMKDCKMTPKLRMLEREMKKHPNGVSRLYPKPVMVDGVVYMDSIEKTEYGFEYYPPTDIVFTSLVCRVISSIVVSLRSLCGVILYGRSGTGKTESVKYYCRLVGRPVFVFCCNEGCELVTLRNVIEAGVLTGSYLCFDEFNRLSSEIMSGATELILSNRNKTKFFLTMNIGYKGRYQLPISLRGVFGEIRIDVPDTKDIIDHYCGEISEKIYQLMCKVEASASKQEHYDFGLRAIRVIARKSGEFEIMKSIVYFYMACLLRKDKAVFVKEMKKAFGTEVGVNLSYKDMAMYGFESGRGVLIVGRNGVGKSRLIRMVRDVRKAICFYYNPKNMGRVFGWRDDLTGEWRDSKFVRDLRRNMHRKEECWFVFDGIVESFWIEDFNSILDENRLLCLSSGERIMIPDHYRFVFESTSTEKLTPATLTRVFLIYMEEGEPSSALSERDASDSEKDIKYDGSKVQGFPFRKLTSTEEQSFYAGSIEALSSDGRRAFFIRGEEGVGKRSLVEEVFSDDVTVIEGKVLEASRMERILGEDKIKRMNGEKVHDVRSVVYIEGFDCTNENLVEVVREYNEYGRVGELEIKNMVLICGIDEKRGEDAVCNTAAERLKRNMRSIFVEAPRNISFLFGEEIRKRFRDTRHFGDTMKILETVLFAYRSLGVSLGKAIGFIRTLRDLCIGEEDIASLMYFESKIYFGECVRLRDEIQRIFGRKVDEIEFDLETGKFRKAGESSDVSYIGSILHRGYNVVIEGPKMSGKHWVIKECMRRMKINVKVVGSSDEKKIDGQTAFLVENGHSLGRSILSRCMVFKLARATYYSVDLLKVYNMVANENISLEDVWRRCLVPEVGICIDSESIGALIETSPLIMNVEEDGHPPSCLHPNVITTSFFCKSIGFVESFVRICKVLREKEAKRKEFLIGGLGKIEEFRKEAWALGSESSRKKKDLEELDLKLDKQLEKIISSQKQLEDEKNVVGNRKKEMEEALKINQKKQEMIDKRLEIAKALLEESRRSIEELPKSSLSEIKVMINPPEIIRNTIEAVFWLVEGAAKGNAERIEWRRLIQFMKREDFVSKVLNCRSTAIPSALEELISDPLFTYEKAQNASKACGSLFMWVIARCKYAKIVEEILPMEEEIAVLGGSILRNREKIEEEEKKLSDIEGRIEDMKNEYNASVLRLESIKIEISTADEKASLVSRIIEELSDEIEKWKRMKYMCPIRHMLTSTDWVLRHNKNGFAHGGNVSELLKARRFICTSLEDKNYQQILSNCNYYGNDVIVYGCDRFDKDVYRALKQQMDSAAYSIILVSNSGTNFYKEYTFNCEFTEKFEAEESRSLERSEERLLELIVGHAPLDEICRHKKALEEERSIDRRHARKREIYEFLNTVFNKKSKVFFDIYGVHLSFRIYKEYVENVLFPILYGKTCNDSTKDMWSSIMDTDIGLLKDMISSDVDLFYSNSLPDTKSGYADILCEIARYPFDYTLVIACDDAIHMIEEKIEITSVISAGPKENNEKIREMLSEKSQESRTYLIKNIHFLRNIKKTGNSRLILTIEEGKKHSLMEDTKVVYCKRCVAREAADLALISEGDSELVRFHMEMASRSSQFGLKDLLLCTENMRYCDREYLKTIVYGSRIDM
ncbi:dynein heavy chain [Encephalitozoon hellem ATCC 50504]|uniref:Dynein heavy chain n=1 Tax=Encephalitozoon hellem TaxID=27973 RepID=A0A9Q9CC39_ENCHE|nr:dynein heavy chain [Encephalitozoon hellem ATCC 50504]AFM99157.1 dynein heavy chain [Encephalitozoon hellem ATCC 50504]UTX44143.1 dynein heavy chain [Encephalitozoon hellem]|eukprot:XP_003888138.1 dynein heavy chain [Encephalitozoon hellem ATCC 50504]